MYKIYLDHDHGKKDKQENEWEKYQEPGEGFRTCPTDQIKNPGPKENVKNLYDKNDSDALNVARIGSETIHTTTAKVL